jgi:hypothetical protein
MPPWCISRSFPREGLPDLGGNQERRRKLAQLEESSERYVAFCGIVSLAAFLLLGWPALLAWVGLAWGMQQFCDAMRGGAPNADSRKSRRTQKSKRRCCD